MNTRPPVIAPATIRCKEIHAKGLSFFALLSMTKSQLLLLTRMDSFNDRSNNTVADAAVYFRLVLKLLNAIKLRCLQNRQVEYSFNEVSSSRSVPCFAHSSRAFYHAIRNEHHNDAIKHDTTDYSIH